MPFDCIFQHVWHDFFCASLCMALCDLLCGFFLSGTHKRLQGTSCEVVRDVAEVADVQEKVLRKLGTGTILIIIQHALHD
jgi:hypothetical protein